MSDIAYSYKFKVRKPYIYEGKRTTTYHARWRVGSEPFKETFDEEGAMNKFIRDLEVAKDAHERFRLEDGLPVSWPPRKTKRGSKPEPEPDQPPSCFNFLRNYTAERWANVSGKQRQNMAEALMWVMIAALPKERRRPHPELLRRALRRFAFNYSGQAPPPEEAKALDWIERHSPLVDCLENETMLGAIYKRFSTCLDGTPRAPESRRRYHRILNTAVEDAVKHEWIGANRLAEFRNNGKRHRVKQSSQAVDRRVCPNLGQFRRLFNAMLALQRLGPMIATYFALIFWAALRPEEAVNVRWSDIHLPAGDNQWGRLLLNSASPTVGSPWSDSGNTREERELKQREVGDTRFVPLCPELVAILRRHKVCFRSDRDDRLFWGERAKMLSDSTCRSILKRARKQAFTEEELASPVARTPYDFRHACISRWLNALIPVADVAAWAGNSPAVVHRKYEHCIDAQLERLQCLLDAADHAVGTAQEQQVLTAA